MRIFAAHIDIALRGAHGQTGNRHAFNQAVRVAFHQQAVGKRARIAFVGIAGNVFLRTRSRTFRRSNRLPFDADGESRTTAPTQARVQHLLHHGLGRHCGRSFETLPATVGFIVLEAEWINHAHTGKGQTLLLGQIGNLLGQSVAQRMRLCLQHASIEQAGQVFHFHRAVGHAALGGFDFNQGFQPQQATRAIAHQLDVQATLFGFGLQSLRHRIGAHGQSGRIAGHIDAHCGACRHFFFSSNLWMIYMDFRLI